MEKEMFEELKKASLSVWKNYKDRPGDYYQEKVDYVNRITNPKDYYILIQMFDINNQKKLYEKLSPEARDYYMEYFNYMKWNMLNYIKTYGKNYMIGVAQT